MVSGTKGVGKPLGGEVSILLSVEGKTTVLWFWQALLSRYLHMYLLLGVTYPDLHILHKVNNWGILTPS